MIFEALTREEAVEMAAIKYGCAKEELEVIERVKPSKKMMGLKKVAGHYEIHVKEKKEQLFEEKKDPENQNGTIEVVDGVVKVTAPKGRGVDASVFINHPQLIFTLNGEMVTGNKSVKEGDQIEISFENISPESHLKIELSENQLEAKLLIDRIPGKRYFLKDMEKTSRGVFQLDFEAIYPKKITVEELKEALITYGIREEFILSMALKKAANTNESIEVVAAKGKPPVESKRPDIVYCKEIFVKEILRGLEPVIGTGDVLAEKKGPAVMGKPGTDVKGLEIKVEKVTDVDLAAIDGAEVVDNKVLATRDGRPYLKKGEVGVVPLLTVIGDLDKDTENIAFDGDVVVKGNVQDHMVIKATGNISIIGSVYHSELYADQNVEIQGKVIGGILQAGDANSIYQVLLPYLSQMLEITEKIFSGLHMNDGRTVQDIMECINNGKDGIDGIFSDIDKLWDMLGSAQAETMADLRKHYSLVFKEIKLLRKEGFNELNILYERVQKIVEDMEEELEDARLIKVVYAQGSTLKSSGDIEITGEGTYQSKLLAGNDIRYTRPGNVVKGGTLIAGKHIHAGIIGTPSEIQTFCKVLDAEGTIEGRFYKGTTLMIKDTLKEYAEIL